ncbi:MAG: DUF1795 domain-containing protein [Ruminococcaceae bacterium]|nr:DUF1795 domain-containing protein [Oscillospiraceae bacterium]
MKKYLSFALAIVFCLLLLASCGKDSFVPNGFQRISNDSADYRFYVPNGWISDLSTGVTAAYISEEDRSSVSFMGFEFDDALIQATFGSEAPDSEVPSDSEAVTTEKVTADTNDNDGSLPSITSIDEYWAYYEKNFAKTFSDMTYTEKGENMLLSGLKAKKYVYTATVTGDSYQFMQVVTIKNGYVYIFTYTSTKDLFESHLDDVNAILGYIEIK